MEWARSFTLAAASAVLLAVAAPGWAQNALSGEPLRIGRLTGPVTIDGDVSEEAWRRAERVDRWYETNPGDNVEPKVRSVGYLAYDDRFFYAAFEFDDPSPSAIRAPLSDRDAVSGNATDYAGVILDTRNDGRSAVFLLATPRGVQYDADTDDASGEDSSPTRSTGSPSCSSDTATTGNCPRRIDWSPPRVSSSSRSRTRCSASDPMRHQHGIQYEAMPSRSI